MKSFDLESRIFFSTLGFEWVANAFKKGNTLIKKDLFFIVEHEGVVKTCKSLNALIRFLKLPRTIRGKKIKVASGIDERGVIAGEHIKAGEVIEVCPVILLPLRNFESPSEIELREKQLMRYQFAWNSHCDALALGLGSLYNHSPQPNAVFKRVYENETISIIAQSEIKKNEEILIDYQYNPLNEVSLEVKEFFNAIKDK